MHVLFILLILESFHERTFVTETIVLRFIVDQLRQLKFKTKESLECLTGEYSPQMLVNQKKHTCSPCHLLISLKTWTKPDDRSSKIWISLIYKIRQVHFRRMHDKRNVNTEHLTGRGLFYNKKVKGSKNVILWVLGYKWECDIWPTLNWENKCTCCVLDSQKTFLICKN